LTDRLARLGYERVREKPDRPGTYFYGHELFWIYRRAHRWNGRDHAASLIGLRLRRRDGMILGAVGPEGETRPLDRAGLLWLEPETIAESLAGDRADRISVDLDDLPEHAWRAVLAAEDARFFDHSGIDARALARAALANVKKGKVVQGGSTITQQLIKNRELTPKRSLGRKASEAVRALFLEAEYDKREILQAYLNQLYFGHLSGVAVHGIGTASQAFFSKPASRLNLAESALLAGIVQGPNRLSPVRHPDAARERRNWVLHRLEELGWGDSAAIEKAKGSRLGVRESTPERSAPVHFLSWVSEQVKRAASDRIEKGRGVVVETTLDPYLQGLAEKTVRRALDRLRQEHRRLRTGQLSAVLISLDARTGEVLAYVGGDPAKPGDAFDRVRKAKRQTGSALKPLVMLEAFESCGTREPLHPASRIADEPMRIDLPSGPWEPVNGDGKFRGTVDARRSLALSLNVPFVRIGRWCGFDQTARRFEKAGIDLPDEPPPSFVLGSVETTPLAVAGAYTVVGASGKAFEPLAVRRVEKPEGRALDGGRPRSRRVVSPATAYLVRDLMRSAVTDGTGRSARIDGVDVAAKTGTSSGMRDAWIAGHAGSLVTVVWVGMDDGSRLGLYGGAGAGPIWQEFMAAAVPARPSHVVAAPRGVAEMYIDPQRGLLVRETHPRARKELFRRRALPPRARFWRADQPVPVIE
jgi:penicillin-binding protein 1B